MSSRKAAALVSASTAALPLAVASALAAGRILVVVPVYNEEESLRPTLRGIFRELPGVRVVVINDCSTDLSSEVARAEGAELVELPCKLGYGGAVQAGFKYAMIHDFNFVLLMDADGQHDPQSAARLLDHVAHGHADVALGSRFLGQANYYISVPRRLGMAAFAFIVKFVTGCPLSDPTSGFQAMNAAVVRFFARDNYPSDFPDADTILLLILSGFRVKELPVIMRARIAGSSMHSGGKALYYVAKMMLSIFIVLLRRRLSNVHALAAKGVLAGDR
jgi:glycosyltransferase involved in cell wall biosynthesis